MYRVQLVDEECIDLSNESNLSVALDVGNAKWGDTIGNCASMPRSPADAAVDIIDVTGIVGRFGGQPGSILKSRADLEPVCLDLKINITDVLAAVAGFQGLSYPFEPTANDPCDSACVSPWP